MSRRVQGIDRTCFFCEKGVHERCLVFDKRTRTCCCGGQPSRQRLSSVTIPPLPPKPGPRKPVPGTLEPFLGGRLTKKEKDELAGLGALFG